MMYCIFRLQQPLTHITDQTNSGMVTLMRERTGCRQPLDIKTIKDADEERPFWNAARKLREEAPGVR